MEKQKHPGNGIREKMSEEHAAKNDTAREVVIRFPQVDPAGIVFYPRYFEMVQRAFPTVPINTFPCGVKTQFLRPNHLGDRIELSFECGDTVADWSVAGSMDGEKYFSMSPIDVEDTDGILAAPMSALFSTAEMDVGEWCLGRTGHMHLSRYFEFLNMAIEEYFEDTLDIPFVELHVGRNTWIPTVQFDTQIVSMPRLDDRVSIHVRPDRLGRRAMTFTSWLIGNGHCHVVNEQVVVFVRMLEEGFESIDIPDYIRSAFEQQRDRANVAT